MSKALAVVVGVLLLVLLVLFSTTYTVRFHEVAVKTRYGRTSEQSVVREPGLHFRLPFFADRVTKYDTRLQLVETPQVEVPTADGQSVVVRAFLMWKVDTDDALKFFGSFPSKRAIEDADKELKDHLQTAVKGSLARYAFDDLIGAESRLDQAESAILDQLASLDLGIEPVTVGISQILLPPKTTTAVLARMQATRSVLAQAERSKGESEADGILSEANTAADKLRAFAEQRAEEIKAEGNEKAAKYLEEMSVDQDLAIFLVDLKALRETLREGTTFVLADEISPWHLLNRRSQLEPGRIPQPKKGSITAPDEERSADEAATTEQDDLAEQPAAAKGES